MDTDIRPRQHLGLSVTISQEAFDTIAIGPLELLRSERASLLNMCLRNLDRIGDSRDDHGPVMFKYHGRFGDDEIGYRYMWQILVPVTQDQWDRVMAWWDEHPNGDYS